LRLQGEGGCGASRFTPVVCGMGEGASHLVPGWVRDGGEARVTRSDPDNLDRLV
jgi:hypothetical protein